MTGWFMTHRHDILRGTARGRNIAARWCVLAEQRLEHLTEMFETGRWRRYHSELAFLENMQEAKRAVQTWKALANGEDAPFAPDERIALRWSPALPPRMPVQPSAVQPATLQPAMLQPKTLRPEALQPKTLQPKPLQPKPLQPKALEPKTLWPQTLQPKPLQPKTLEPKTLQPKALEPKILWPETLQPKPLQPKPLQPETFQPKTFQPKTFQTKTLQPKTVRPAWVPVELVDTTDRLAETTEAPVAPVAEPARERSAVAPHRGEFALTLDGIQAKYPLLRNSF
jgi:uncharacterized repeat protein (TIGR03809 family)